MLGGVFNQRDFARKEAVANIVTSRIRSYPSAKLDRGSRADFAETVYWNAGVKTDASTGVATVSFNLSDSVTSFRVLADGFTQDGTLGSEHQRSRIRATFLDRTEDAASGHQRRCDPASDRHRQWHEPGTARRGHHCEWRRRSQVHHARRQSGDTRCQRAHAPVCCKSMSAASSPAPPISHSTARPAAIATRVSRKLDVQPLGFPHESSTGGMLERNGSKSFEFTLPSDMVRGSVSSSVDGVSHSAGQHDRRASVVAARA